MHEEEMSYRSFLLRLWHVKQCGEISWRASLEDPHTGQLHFFSRPDELNEFLQELRQELEDEARTGKEEIA